MNTQFDNNSIQGDMEHLFDGAKNPTPVSIDEEVLDIGKNNEEWILGGCSGRMITTSSGYYGDGFIADVDTLANAKAICKAVNGTYGKGLDPDKVEEVVTALSKILALKYEAGRSRPYIDEILLIANNALNHIKL